MRKIVVAIDDSDNARAALRWAIDNKRSDDEVVAVHAWQLPTTGGFEIGMLDPGPFEEGATVRLDEIVGEVLGDDASTTVRQVVICGHTPTVLLEQVTPTDLLVLGSRGHGGFMGLLLGSVTSSVVQHARCPTVVVPDPARVAEADQS